MFNDKILPLLRQLRAVPVKERHLGQLKHPRALAEPHCTRSLYVEYHDANGGLVAGAHMYVRPDGQLGASGKPDPKFLRLGDTIFYAAED